MSPTCPPRGANTERIRFMNGIQFLHFLFSQLYKFSIAWDIGGEFFAAKSNSFHLLIIRLSVTDLANTNPCNVQFSNHHLAKEGFIHAPVTPDLLAWRDIRMFAGLTSYLVANSFTRELSCSLEPLEPNGE